jgi:hypothetical protein
MKTDLGACTKLTQARVGQIWCMFLDEEVLFEMETGGGARQRLSRSKNAMNARNLTGWEGLLAPANVPWNLSG